MIFRFSAPLWLIKLFNYEYWTWWLFFLPLAPYWLFLAIRNRSLTYFTTVNPCIPDGGVFGESKMDILTLIDPEYLPAAVFVPLEETWDSVNRQLKQAGITFPLIVKPDVGGRGFKVYKIHSSDELKKYLTEINQPVIIQEYVNYTLELGVMYARLPHETSGRITSVVEKEFLSVTGDGRSTVGELLQQNQRARFSMEELRERVKERWDEILPQGEKQQVQPIGNHCLGTKFLNANYRINADLVRVFDRIALPMEGFYYGRFDLRVPDWEALYAGKNIRILELNGATSEPGHVYDPNYRLWKAYRDIMDNMRIVADISAVNMQHGFKPTPLRKLIQTARAFFAVSGQL
jgi:hypothetical protein